MALALPVTVGMIIWDFTFYCPHVLLSKSLGLKRHELPSFGFLNSECPMTLPLETNLSSPPPESSSSSWLISLNDIMFLIWPSPLTHLVIHPQSIGYKNLRPHPWSPCLFSLWPPSFRRLGWSLLFWWWWGESGYQTQDRMHPKQLFHHWTTSAGLLLLVTVTKYWPCPVRAAGLWENFLEGFIFALCHQLSPDSNLLLRLQD